MRVIHLPTLVGGNPWHLSRGERELGIESYVLANTKHPFGYDYDYLLNLDGRPYPSKLAALVKAFFYARKFDVVHFNFGSSLFHIPLKGLYQAELPFYSKRQKLFVTYQGCDARQKYPTMKRAAIASCHVPDCYNGQCNDGKLDEVRRRGIAKMSRYVEHIWAVNPDLLHFLPEDKSSFLPYAITPVPKRSVQRKGKRLRILHAPTDQGAKGSGVIVPALRRLQLTYPNDVEIVQPDKLPREAFLDLLATCDLCVDQILSGWYGGAAVESMTLGVPVAVRIEENDLRFIPESMRGDLAASVLNIHPGDIFEKLCLVVEDRMVLRRLSEAGQEFARKWHAPKAVARIVAERYGV